MNEVTIYINNISDITTFLHIASKSKHTLTLCSNRYKVDAKSLLGLLSLNLSEPITLKFDEIEPNVLEEIKKYKVVK